MKTSKKMFGIILIIIGLTLTIFGIGFVISPKQENDVKLASETTEIKPTENLSNLVEKPSTATERVEEKIKSESEIIENSKAQLTQDDDLAGKKGLEFTKAIIAKFDKKYFKLKEWRSDKYEDGVYPEANMYPDLEFEFSLRNVKSIFAIECKWRKNYYKNGIEWAKEYQLKNYNKFKRDRSVPVFVAIGVGGTPQKPSEVYVIPLASIENIFLTQEELKKYKKVDFDDKGFFYDSKTQILK